MQSIIKNKVDYILSIQKAAWENGHENYGAEIDVLNDMLYFLKRFPHLNPKQKQLYKVLGEYENLQYGRKLCSKAHKSVRHFIVTLK